MNGGNFRDFVDNLHYGEEMYFTFDGKNYFMQGWNEDKIFHLVLDYNYSTEDYIAGSSKYIWESSSNDAAECVDNFLSAPLWNGKNFYEAEKKLLGRNLFKRVDL